MLLLAPVALVLVLLLVLQPVVEPLSVLGSATAPNYPSASLLPSHTAERKRLGFWLVPGGADSPRSEACDPPLVNISGFVFDWSSLDGPTATAMARCGAAGVKNLLRLDLGPHRGSRLFPTVETPYMYHSPEAKPSATGCPPYSRFPHNDWDSQPPVCCRVPNGTRCGSGTFACCNTAAPSAKAHPCSSELPACVWEPGLRLLDNFTAVWKSWLPTVQQLHAAGALHGVFLGDELLLAGLPLSNLSSLADLIRADFPRGAPATEPDFIIYENDAYSPIKGGIDGLNRPVSWENATTPASPWRVPSSLDWISMDLYRLNASYVQTEFRAVYEQHLYPRMHEHQRAIVVPAAYAAMGDDPSVNWSIPQYDATMQAIAWAAYNWTVSDPRVAGIAPWHWYDDGRPGPYSYGVASLPRTRAAYTAISSLLNRGAKNSTRKNVN